MDDQNKGWYYLVTLLIGTSYDDVEDPKFRFELSEKQNMYEFVDTCLENGHEVKIVHRQKI